MSESLCVVCENRPTPDGYACRGCAGRASDHLDAIAELAPDARLVAAGLVRRGGGGGSNKPGSRPPLNDGATDAVDEVQNLLTTLARDIAETRGLQSVSAASERRLVPDPLIAAARWLGRQLEWLRHAVDGTEPYAIRAFDEIAGCAGRLRGIVNGPGEQKFLGPCHATVTWDAEGAEIPRDDRCEGDVFAYIGAKEGTCRACKARWVTANRQAWLDGKVREHAYRASEIAQAYTVNVNTIRSWAARGQLVPHGHDAEARPLFNVGDVLDLAAADAARRATEQAKRARRAAARETAEMGA
jgi:hypothetical protein